jgi:hypothetical protein
MTVRSPDLHDLLFGRVTPAAWTADLFRFLRHPSDEADHEYSREGGGEDDIWWEMGASLTAIGMELVDFRQADKSKRGARKGSRSWDQVDGDCFHQTASFVDDVELCVKIPAHALITPTAVGIAHPPTAYLYCQHAGNRRFNGVEIACRAAGIEGDPRTLWRNKKERKADKPARDIWREPTVKQLEATFIVARYHARLNALRGHPHTAYCFHRNTHRSRVGDTGSRAALYLGRRLQAQLGLVPLVKLGSGTITPRRWGNPDGGRYSRRVD